MYNVSCELVGKAMNSCRRFLKTDPRFILVLFCWLGGAQAQEVKPVYMNQGWASSDRTVFYTTSQGSQLMPYSWFLALEQPDNETLFRVDNLARFGYLPNADKRNNPDGLPLGFVKDDADNNDWVGMNCSACHTSQFKFAGRTLQIDGGPTDADFWAFISELGIAVSQTSTSPTHAKFKRFANRVLSPTHSQENELLLYRYLKDFSDEFNQLLTSSNSNVAWGRARLDAFGMIFNRATAIDLGDWGNAHKANAPVSYPFLWGTHWHNVVQWNGSAPNTLEIERLARNVGEAMGVFAHTDIKRTFLPPLYFKSTVKRVNQIALEKRVATLRSPVWPGDLSKIDAKKAAKGAKLYQANCVRCHAITPRNEPFRRINVTMTPLSEVGTDPLMATNARDLSSKSGILEGVEMPFLLSAPLSSEVATMDLVGKIVVGAILAPYDWEAVPDEIDAEARDLLASIKSNHLHTDGHQAQSKATKSKIELGTRSKLWSDARNLLEKRKNNINALAYKARPLDGIWATAPYLHNGSIPNLYQLLLPAKDRVTKFFVATREFDLVNVGFTTGRQHGAFEFDTSLPGNSNAGHDSYGTDSLTNDQRFQLVEYLKTL
ncbi:hypothetical protein C8R31_10651 [Nitrosospira sp. Nsp2]|uniref:di-heme-cytochrome C peroxidase n=1 Tax=Nitrosospira sp. Nsp2 TaxID=136548 RepID=UPI000D4B089C|nr:di-heme-cytochrome C peroxidase [Nitrosospira sp. Nsp2]PTR14379.1 hypothetical protein C8R31_10651 [Nitrosospira sp. Nsp2]